MQLCRSCLPIYGLTACLAVQPMQTLHLWRLSFKISLALDLWRGTTLRSTWNRWHSLCR